MPRLRAQGPSVANPLIDRAAVKPFDPIACPAAVARSDGQGRPATFPAIRTFSAGRSGRRSLALDRCEHGGRLSACRNAELRAIVRRSMAMLSLCALLGSVLPVAAAEVPCSLPQLRGNPAIASKIDWSIFVREAAKRFDISERLIRAVIYVESGGDVRAVSSKGALGLMQIMQTTWQELRIKHRLGSNPFDPRDNILAGAAYLREMRDRFGARGFLAAYNAGPQRYDEHRSKGRPLPRETIDYVAKLMPLIKGTAEIPRCPRQVESRSSADHSPLFDDVADVASDAKLSDRGSPNNALGGMFATILSVGMQQTGAFITDLTALEAPSEIAPKRPGVTPKLDSGDLFVRRFSGVSR
jgi:soluble lytic murein transglycosylase-like protein